jgi:Ca2+-binding RTX toxin-like protein
MIFVALGLIGSTVISPAYAAEFPPPILKGRALYCDGHLATIVGAGTIVGTAGNDVIVGSSGIDNIQGGNGDDIICGMGGDDMLRGGWGNDRIFGGDGNDTLAGNWGYDALDGGPGNDTLYMNWEQEIDDAGAIEMGGDGNDDLYMGPGVTYACGNGTDYRHQMNLATGYWDPPVIC